MQCHLSSLPCWTQTPKYSDSTIQELSASVEVGSLAIAELDGLIVSGGDIAHNDWGPESVEIGTNAHAEASEESGVEEPAEEPEGAEAQLWFAKNESHLLY